MSGFYNLGVIIFDLLFNAHGVVALKFSALIPELFFDEMELWLRQMDVFDGPYCAKVGFVFIPLQVPRCWQK